MKRLLFFLSALVLSATLSLNAAAQTGKDDYNLKKALEIIKNDGDLDEALDLLDKQLELTPRNPRALVTRVRVYFKKDDYGRALSDVNVALRYNNPAKSGVNNSSLYWWKAAIYYELEDMDNSIIWYKKAYDQVRKDNPESVQSVSFRYAQVLYNAERLDESDAVYKKMLADDETDVEAMVGLARNHAQREDYRAALDLLEKARKISPDYDEIYRYTATSYDALGEKTKAIDAIIKYFDLADDPRWSLTKRICLTNENYAIANIKARIKKTEKPVYWHAFLAELYESAFQYRKAIGEYEAIEAERGKSHFMYERKAYCYRNLGLHEKAIELFTAAIEEQRDYRNLVARGVEYRLCGDFARAIEDFTASIEEDGRHAFTYYSRGWAWELSGDDKKALEDYNTGIDIDQSYPYIYLTRGLLLKKMGKSIAAKADFEQVVKMDTVATEGSCTHYALLELGRGDEAVEWMQKIIDENPRDFGNTYDQACLYARMDKPNLALDKLEKALELGYRNFKHLEYDHDMNPIRDTKRYKDLVAKYKAIFAEEIKADDLPGKEPALAVSEIAFSRRHGGTFEVPCEINGLPLKMIFDTGASDVSISSVEANFMLKNDYLSEKDIKGKRYYQTANGQISPGAVITLREVRLGDAVLKNVEASVVNSQSAPLLFGQSAMERFGTITIDNDNNKLIIKH